MRRVAKDKDFQYLLDDIALVVKQRKENQISLNEAVRRKERDAGKRAPRPVKNA
jgi:carboxyl-terminal processing protease